MILKREHGEPVWVWFEYGIVEYILELKKTPDEGLTYENLGVRASLGLFKEDIF